MIDNIENYKFDLNPNIIRTTKQRIDMVLDPNCPADVLKIVALHDTDNTVIELCAISCNTTSEICNIVMSRLNVTMEYIELSKKYWQRTDIKNSLCILPWIHAATTSNGSLKMCCQMIYPVNDMPYGELRKDDGTLLTNADDIDLHRNVTNWKKIRQLMLEGKRPDACKLCWDDEKNGMGSQRQVYNELFGADIRLALKETSHDGIIDPVTFPIKYWDIRFGNKCNLACRSCSPADSDMWYKDWMLLYDDDTFKNKNNDTIHIVTSEKGQLSSTPDVYNWYNDSKLIDYLEKNIHVIQRFYFTGGEPTVNITHRKLLDYIIKTDYAKNITLVYNTNMAVLHTKLFDQWKQFKKVELGMSIDGIHNHFEYIRHPGKWNVVERNMIKIDNEPGLEHVAACITMTVSILNVLHLLDVIVWMKEQKWKRIETNIAIHNLYTPGYLNIQNATIPMKQYITDRYTTFLTDIKHRFSDDINWYTIVESILNGITTHMNSAQNNVDVFNRGIEIIKKLDTIRNENFESSLPELYAMIERCKE